MDDCRLLNLTRKITYLSTSWHVAQIIIAKEGVNRCLLWIAEDLQLKDQSFSTRKSCTPRTVPHIKTYGVAKKLLVKFCSFPPSIKYVKTNQCHIGTTFWLSSNTDPESEN